ncbi:MAG: UvrB/UvrC motif-containing protein [Planctomycetota bacterium]|jgi:protein arginine kinase activator
MFHKCDRCDRPAVVRETILKQGVHKEVYLCEEHAKEAGIAMPGHTPLKHVLTQLLVTQADSPRVLKKSCSTCGLTFAQFRQVGTLGCPACYEAFHRHLASLIERAQSGGTQHIGKAPRRVGPTIDRQLQIQRLVKELDDAVAAEEYERAAKLRDSLKDLQPEASGSEQDNEARTTGS